MSQVANTLAMLHQKQELVMILPKVFSIAFKKKDFDMSAVVPSDVMGQSQTPVGKVVLYRILKLGVSDHFSGLFVCYILMSCLINNCMST